MSAKFRFIKGPWKAETCRTKDGAIQINIVTAYDVYDGARCLGPETICTIGGFPTVPLDGGKEWEATGHLIAKAPEMFELLKYYDKMLDYFDDIGDDPLCTDCDYNSNNYIGDTDELCESCKENCDWGKLHDRVPKLLSLIYNKSWW